MLDLDAGRAAILDLGSEDYYHLADAAVYLPTVPLEERRGVARAAMRQLLGEGLVQLFFGDLARNVVTAVPVDEALVVIEDPQAWDPEHYYPNSYCFLNTDAGDAVYYGHAPTNPGPHRPNDR